MKLLIKETSSGGQGTAGSQDGILRWDGGPQEQYDIIQAEFLNVAGVAGSATF